MEAAHAHYAPNGVNGTPLHMNGAGPSKVHSPPPPTHHDVSTPPMVNGVDGMGYHMRPSHNESIVHHLYTSGFQHGNYADVNLRVLNRPYRLHAIILSRSPYLAHLLNTANSNTIYVPIEDEPLITEDGFAIALGYLYSAASMGHLTPDNARAVLAAGCLLGGMDELCMAAYELCRESISVESIQDWLHLLNNPGSSPGPSSPASSVPGTPTVEHNTVAILGPYGKRLRDDVFTFLVVTLPVMVQAFPKHGQRSSGDGTSTPGETGQDVLFRIYSILPFDIFKHAVESPAFPVASDQARFQFAKEAIAARKKTPGGREAEESVVLAFGKTDGGSAVHITRKMKKKPLWKVSKQ